MFSTVYQPLCLCLVYLAFPSSCGLPVGYYSNASIEIRKHLINYSIGKMRLSLYFFILILDNSPILKSS